MKDMAPSATRTRKRDWRTILREELPRLLREDPEVRAQVFASLSEYFTTREETAALLAELREMRRVFSAHAEEQGRRLEEQGRILTEQGERLERLTAAVEEHTRTLAEHGERLERLTVAVEEQGRRLEEQGRILTEQGERLERLTAAVEEHTRTLAEQGERLERLTVAVEEQGRRLEEHSRILAEHGERLERLTKAVEEQGRRLEEHSRILAEHGERLERLTKAVEEQGRRLEEHGRILAEHSDRLERLTLVVEKLVERVEVQGQLLEARGRDIDTLQRTLGGIGARWGLLAEETFREAVRTLFTEQPGVRVEHWRGRDEQGEIFGYPADVELDAVVRDGTHVLVEIKSSVSAADVTVFARKAAVYEASTGVRATRKLMVTPYADVKARETAARLGIEIVVGVTPPEV